MAQTIIGLDIGSFSVKVVTMNASFRSMSWTGFREYEIPHGERDRPHRAAAEDPPHLQDSPLPASSVHARLRPRVGRAPCAARALSRRAAGAD